MHRASLPDPEASGRAASHVSERTSDPVALGAPAPSHEIGRVLVANRGAIAARVIRTVNSMGIDAVAVYSDADRDAPYLDDVDEAYHLGPAHPQASYLNADRLLDVLESSGCDAVHPGYGFLAESPSFAEAVTRRGVQWIGPPVEWIETMGHKTNARARAEALGLPTGAGSAVLPEAMSLAYAEAEKVGYPLVVKPAEGGGGIGMTTAHSRGDLEHAIERARSIALRGFGAPDVYLERLIEKPRHIEIQVLGDRHGNVAHLFERDCSVQRRHQKLIEEAPAPSIDRDMIEALSEQTALALAIGGFDNAGTVEMLMTGSGEMTFLEMNTRLQVEHGVTEAVTGLDLVKAQIEVAGGRPVSRVVGSTPGLRGHAIEARVYAEDPVRFFPSPGRLEVFRPPTGSDLRVETGFREGQEVTRFYDPLLAKVISWGSDRSEARLALVAALREFTIEGVKSNIPALIAVLESPEFRSGAVHTELLSDILAPTGKEHSLGDT